MQRDPFLPAAVLILGVACALLSSCATTTPTTAPPPEMTAAPAWLDAGPMIGHVSDHDARIWLRPAEDAAFEVAAAQGGRPVAHRVESIGDGCRLIVLERLAPDTEVSVLLSPAGDGDPIPLRFNAAPAPATSGRVRIAFGSCVKDSEFGGAPVLRGMFAAEPDLCLFVGDNTYYIRGDHDTEHRYSTSGPRGEWSDETSMLARQLVTRRLPDLQPLLRSVPCYAVWDDHDYGPNNSDSTFPGRDAAARVFREVWANPGYGLDHTPGIFSSFRRGPVEVFLMDNRYHRSPEDTPDEVAVIWGDAQLGWLLEELSRSRAPVKLIVNGTQIINKGGRDDHHWHAARREYYRFIEGLQERDVTGVVFLTGDRHYSELMRLRIEGHPDRYEFTSSPIAQGRELGARRDENPTRLFAMDGDSFGLVTIDVGGPSEGTLTFECRDRHGEVVTIDGEPRARTVDLGDLTSRWPGE